MESEGRGRAPDFTAVKIDTGANGGKLVDAVVEGHDGGALIARTCHDQR
jgi:hypothetical protein